MLKIWIPILLAIPLIRPYIYLLLAKLASKKLNSLASKSDFFETFVLLNTWKIICCLGTYTYTKRLCKVKDAGTTRVISYHLGYKKFLD